jgi:hypothetical protein
MRETAALCCCPISEMLENDGIDVDAAQLGWNKTLKVIRLDANQ